MHGCLLDDVDVYHLSSSKDSSEPYDTANKGKITEIVFDLTDMSHSVQTLSPELVEFPTINSA